MGQRAERETNAKGGTIRRTAIGCRAHSGWAALVAVALSPKGPLVVERRRITIADRSIAGSKQPYHFVETWALPSARAFLDRCESRTKDLSLRGFEALSKELRAKEYTVIGCGLLTASGRPVLSLEQALSSHAMLHTAEGEFYRNALAGASQICSIPVTRMKEKGLVAQAAETFGAPVEKLQQRLTDLGRNLGPPWTQDEKLAALAAWLVLTADSPSTRNRKKGK